MEPVTVLAAPQKVSFIHTRIKRFSFLVSGSWFNQNLGTRNQKPVLPFTGFPLTPHSGESPIGPAQYGC